MSTVLSKLPRQRLSFASKNKTWRKENLDYADKYSFYNNEYVRQTLKNRVVNLNLYNGKIAMDDIAASLNPHGLTGSFAGTTIPHHPILVPKVDLLVGEEINRKFDWHLTVTNPDAISKKEKDKAKIVKERLIAIMQQNLSKEELDEELLSLDKYLKYEWQDLRERMGNQLLKHYYSELNFDLKFNEGFKNVLIMGEEVYQCDILHDEPTFEKLNSLKVHAVRSGNSSRIEDSDLIIIEDHWSPGKIIDVFHDEMKPKDIDYVTQYTSNSSGAGKYTVDDENHLLIRDNEDHAIDSYLNVAEINGHHFSSDFVDSVGNVRVLRVYWRSQKKILKVKFYDPTTGEEMSRLESEEYIVNPEIGEEATSLWVNEWWEGTKVGKELYLKMKPKKVQYTRLSNPSSCHPGIVGEIYNTNQGVSVSLVDRMKNYQYLYDIIWDRLNKAIAKNLGKILLLDIAVVPEGWEPEKWMAQAVSLGVGLTDGFKEGNLGAAQGKMAGNLNGATATRAIDLETGNYIQQHINLLEFIKMEMGEIAGVSKQREGQVANRESVGGVERAVTQSSHITEWWFMKHEDVKKRCLSVFLETAKIALGGNNKKLQYIGDDFTKQIINIDGTEISEVDYGITITTSSATKELKDTMKQLSQAFMQNGGSFGTIIDILASTSIVDMRRKIESSEDKIQQAASEQGKQEAQQIKAKMELDQANIEADRELKKYEIDVKAETELNKLLINSEEDVDPGTTEGEDLKELEKIQLAKRKQREDHLAKMKALDQNWKMHQDKMEREDKKIGIAKANKSATSK